MSTIEQSIDVHVPVRTAYDQWTQFEQFPQFMEGVEEVRQLDDTHTRWVTKVAWTSEDGPEHAGVVTFHRLGDGETRVMLQMDYEPEGAVEKVGDALGVVKHRVKGDLERFKELVEAQGGASGAWRGEVDQTATR